MANTTTNESPESYERPSGGAVGWTSFAGLMMVLMGIWWIIAGVVAIGDPGFYVVTQDWVFRFNPSTWGWIHLILGVIVLTVGFGLFGGSGWARTGGVLFAAVAGLIAFAWLPWYPIWAIVLLLAAVSIIWALTTHGREITAR